LTVWIGNQTTVMCSALMLALGELAQRTSRKISIYLFMNIAYTSSRGIFKYVVWSQIFKYVVTNL